MIEAIEAIEQTATKLVPSQSRVIRVHVGDRVYAIEADAVQEQIAQRMPGMLGNGDKGGGKMDPARAALRSGIKGVIGLGMPVLRRFVAGANEAAYAETGVRPFPEWDTKAKRQDMLDDFANYVLQLILAFASSAEWVATVEQDRGRDGGDFRITSLSPKSGTTEAASPTDSGTTEQPAS